jgi:hypothetical protein
MAWDESSTRVLVEIVASQSSTTTQIDWAKALKTWNKRDDVTKAKHQTVLKNRYKYVKDRLQGVIGESSSYSSTFSTISSISATPSTSTANTSSSSGSTTCTSNAIRGTSSTGSITSSAISGSGTSVFGCTVTSSQPWFAQPNCPHSHQQITATVLEDAPSGMKFSGLEQQIFDYVLTLADVRTGTNNSISWEKFRTRFIYLSKRATITRSPLTGTNKVYNRTMTNLSERYKTMKNKTK